MKERRRTRILQLLRERVVETQGELVEILKCEGVPVTQATISRDIKEMGLVKVAAGDGRCRYAASQGTPGDQEKQLSKLFHECVLKVVEAENLIVVTTLTATVHAVSEAVSGLDWPEIVGSLVGGRNVFLFLQSKETAARVAERLRGLMG